MTAYDPHDFTTGSIATNVELNSMLTIAGYDRTTTDVSTDDTEVAALSVTVTVLDSQLLWISVDGRVSCDTANAQIVGKLTADSGDIQQVTRFTARNNGEIDILSGSRLYAPGGAGTVTIELIIFRGAGTGDVSLLHDSGAPGELVVFRATPPA